MCLNRSRQQEILFSLPHFSRHIQLFRYLRLWPTHLCFGAIQNIEEILPGSQHVTHRVIFRLSINLLGIFCACSMASPLTGWFLILGLFILVRTDTGATSKTVSCVQSMMNVVYVRDCFASFLVVWLLKEHLIPFDLQASQRRYSSSVVRQCCFFDWHNSQPGVFLRAGAVTVTISPQADEEGADTVGVGNVVTRELRTRGVARIGKDISLSIGSFLKAIIASIFLLATLWLDAFLIRLEDTLDPSTAHFTEGDFFR